MQTSFYMQKWGCIFSFLATDFSTLFNEPYQLSRYQANFRRRIKAIYCTYRRFYQRVPLPPSIKYNEPTRRSIHTIQHPPSMNGKPRICTNFHVRFFPFTLLRCYSGCTSILATCFQRESAKNSGSAHFW